MTQELDLVRPLKPALVAGAVVGAAALALDRPAATYGLSMAALVYAAGLLFGKDEVTHTYTASGPSPSDPAFSAWMQSSSEIGYPGAPVLPGYPDAPIAARGFWYEEPAGYDPLSNSGFGGYGSLGYGGFGGMGGYGSWGSYGGWGHGL